MRMTERTVQAVLFLWKNPSCIRMQDGHDGVSAYVDSASPDEDAGASVA